MDMDSLILLALIDSLSIGTLVIPLILLLQPKLKRGYIATYALTLGLFYFALGTLLLLGLGSLLTPLSKAVDSQAGLWVQLVIGSVLLIWALFYDTAPFQRMMHGKNWSNHDGTQRWEARLAGSKSIATIISVALLAGTFEAATMAPYLAAIGTLATSNNPLNIQLGILAIYCVIMFVPAMILAVFRFWSGQRFDHGLLRFKTWAAKQVTETTPWIVGIIAFFVARYAAYELFFAR